MSGAGERRNLRLVPGASARPRWAPAHGTGEDLDSLVADAACGDREALREVVTAHEALVLAVVRRCTRTPEDVRDLVRQAFRRALRSARRTLRRDPERSLAFRRSLLRAALRAARIQLHREVQLVRTPLELVRPADPHGPGRRDAIPETSPTAAARSAVLRLPWREREVLTLSVDAQLRVAEIADVLGITAAAVKANLAKACAALRVAAFPGAGAPRPCAELAVSLSLRAAGALERLESARVEVHVARCGACRAEADVIAEALSAASLPPAGEAERRALEGVDAHVSGAVGRGLGRVRLLRAVAVAVGALAATAALAVALLRHSPLLRGW